MDERLHSEEKVLLAIELSNSKWRLRFTSSREVQKRREKNIAAGDVEALGLELQKAREKFGMPAARVVSCYEAGRDGFWLCRWFRAQRQECLVVESSSIKRDRRRKQIKTDGVDAEELLEQLVDLQVRGKSTALRLVRVPSEQVEWMQRSERERERLIKEQTGHRARIRSVLVLQGIRVGRVTRLQCEQARDWQGRELSGEVREELRRELERLELGEQQWVVLSLSGASSIRYSVTNGYG